MLGYGVALSRARAHLAERRTAELTREQEARTQAAVKQEQARIAREMHDIVTHDVSVIVAQAAAARRVLATQPGAAEESLSAIEAVGRDALDGLRSLVGLLRTDHGESERFPQPGLDRLPWLLTQVRGAGLPVDLSVVGEARRLPAAVDHNAYRIVQEALTNSLKHAGPTRTAITLNYQDDTLDIEIRDHGPAPGSHRSAPAPSTGYGLISMQQRAAMLGGVLTAGSAEDRGFRVSARLPVAGGAR
jgi:signal transduction histidine kinase